MRTGEPLTCSAVYGMWGPLQLGLRIGIGDSCALSDGHRTEQTRSLLRIGLSHRGNYHRSGNPNWHLGAPYTVGFSSGVSIEIAPPRSSPLLCPREDAARVAPSVLPPLLARESLRLAFWPSFSPLLAQPPPALLLAPRDVRGAQMRRTVHQVSFSGGGPEHEEKCTLALLAFLLD